MEVILSVAVSLDGFMDDCSTERLVLSSPEDWAAVLDLRAECDAILVGAETIRRDNPSLVIRDEARRAARVARGMSPDITKVTLTGSGNIDPLSGFFTEGNGRKIVFADARANRTQLDKLTGSNVIYSDGISARHIGDTLAGHGYRRLMVEGGAHVLRMFLREECADALRLAVAPFFVGGGECAPRFTDGKPFPFDKHHRIRLEKTEQLGDMAVMWYKFDRK